MFAHGYIYLMGAVLMSVFVSDASAHCKLSHPGHCAKDAVKIVTPPEIRVIEKIVIDGKSPEDAVKLTIKEEQKKIDETISIINDVDNTVIEAVRKTLGDDAANIIGFVNVPQTLERSATLVVTSKITDIIVGEKSISQAIKETISLPLEIALRQAYDAIKDRSLVIPNDIANLLAVEFDPAIINDARYIESDFEANLAALINSIQSIIGESSGNNHAVTINNVIVFESVPTVISIKFWAHEMAHVEQYKILGGIDEFSAEYLENYSEIEAEAVDRADSLEKTLKLIQGIKERQEKLAKK